MALVVGPLRHRAHHFVLVLNPKEEHLSFGSIIATQVVVYAVDLEHRGLEARMPTFTRILFSKSRPVLHSRLGVWGPPVRGWDRTDSGVFSLSLSVVNLRQCVMSKRLI